LAAGYIDLSLIPRFAFDEKYAPFKRKLIRWSSHSGASSSREEEKDCIVSASASSASYDEKHNERGQGLQVTTEQMTD
jgi:hypothetical protein